MSRKEKDMCIVQCMYIAQCVQTGEQVLKHVWQEQCEPKRKEGRQPTRQGVEDMNVGCT